MSDRKLEISSLVSNMATDPSLETFAPRAPVTGVRKLNINLQKEMPAPYLARALVAADPSHPKGSEGHEHNNMSVLQQHVAFFDRNKDGIIYPVESYTGLRLIGVNIILSLLVTIALHLLLSYPTLPGFIPSLRFPIYIKNIHKAKHGSDSETYDTEGRFDPSKFDAIFSKYATKHSNALTLGEIFKMINANHNFLDLFGSILSVGEFVLLYIIAKDENGLLQRESIRGALDGSLFEKLERSKRA